MSYNPITNRKIWVFTHKDDPFVPELNAPFYERVDVRRMDRDSIGEKNKVYNEYCGMYWLWKNTPTPNDTDWVGYAHYRRYLVLPDVLQEGKAYVHLTSLCSNSIKEQYKKCHMIDDWNAFKASCFKGKELEDFERWEQEETLIQSNLVQYTGVDFKKHQEFMHRCYVTLENLFSVKAIDLSGRSPYQMRAPSFILERMTDFWLRSKSSLEIVGVQMKELDIPNMENSTR